MESNITENNISLAILVIAAMSRDGTVSFNELREKIPLMIQLSKYDLEISSSRPNLCNWEQRMRNVVNHMSNRGNIIREGYVKYIPDLGYEITPKGRKFVENKNRIVHITLPATTAQT